MTYPERSSLKCSMVQQTSLAKNVKKSELSCTAGGIANWCDHDGNQCGDSSKN